MLGMEEHRLGSVLLFWVLEGRPSSVALTATASPTAVGEAWGGGGVPHLMGSFVAALLRMTERQCSHLHSDWRAKGFPCRCGGSWLASSETDEGTCLMEHGGVVSASLHGILRRCAPQDDRGRDDSGDGMTTVGRSFLCALWRTHHLARRAAAFDEGVHHLVRRAYIISIQRKNRVQISARGFCSWMLRFRG